MLLIVNYYLHNLRMISCGIILYVNLISSIIIFFSIDRFAISFYETLAHLEVQHNKKEFSINKSRNDYELQIFIRMELYQKEEVSKYILFLIFI